MYNFVHNHSLYPWYNVEMFIPSSYLLNLYKLRQIWNNLHVEILECRICLEISWTFRTIYDDYLICMFEYNACLTIHFQFTLHQTTWIIIYLVTAATHIYCDHEMFLSISSTYLTCGCLATRNHATSSWVCMYLYKNRTLDK